MRQRRLFGTNGIRGVVNQDLTPELVLRVAAAVGTFFRGGKILVGHDGRTSSPMFAQAVVGGLLSAGCTVYFAGMAPTPTLQYAVKHYRMDGGVIVTASHNPPEYNGVKVLGGEGIELSRKEEAIVEEILFKEKAYRADWDEIGEVKAIPNIVDVYLESVKRHVDVEAIRRRRFRVVVDPGNGVAGLTVPRLLREMGCQVISINSNVDGTFPSRPPEPKPENLGELASVVRAVQADVGVAYDGDGDRAIFVDEKGQVHWGDQTFALVERHFLEENPGEIIVTPVSSSRLIEDVARAYGGRVIWTKVGSIHVSYKMRELGARLGGEENGGILYAPHQPVRDGAMATALMLEILAKEGKSLSEMISELPRYHVGKDRVKCPNELKWRVLERLVHRLSDLNPDTTDGVKIWFPDGSSVLVRPSGTEPIYRIYAEARTRERLSQLIQEYKGLVEDIIRKARP